MVQIKYNLWKWHKVNLNFIKWHKINLNEIKCHNYLDFSKMPFNKII